MTGTTSEIESGLALQRQGRLKEAEAVYRAVLDKQSDDAEALKYLGLVCYQTGQLEPAEAFLRRSLTVDPACANAWSNLGMVQVKQTRREDALRSFAKALALDSRHTDAMHNMAVALKQMGRFDRALVLLRRLTSLRLASPEALCSLAEASYAGGDLSAAAESYHEAIRLDPTNAAARLGLGEVSEARGRFNQARLQYLAVLRRDPEHPLALARLLQLREGVLDVHRVESAERLAANPALKRRDRIRLNVALAHYHDRTRGYDAAFRYLKRGCDEQALDQPFDSDGYSIAIDSIIAALTSDFYASARHSGRATRRPIFIVGMPRSGTTLTEQILASHSQVAAAGESSALLTASRRIVELSGGTPYPTGLRELGREALAQLATGYLAELDKVNSTSARITDKLPFNFMHLGVAALLFPDAAFVHCRRQPVDNCLSCYFTSFADEIRFANDLTTLGRYYADYDRLMRHWQTVLPVSILDLHYEDLVGSTEPTIRRLLEHCGLDWEDSCLRFHETERGVRTPSRWQVRQPIYNASVARWRHYEPYLEPLKKGLGAVLADSTMY